jgi:N-methylhydantoinase B
VREALDWVLDYSERRVRDQIRRWSSGTYSARSYLDTDFAGGRDIELHVSITVRDDDITVDFTGSSPQSIGIVNSVPANTLAFVYCAFSALCPEVPINSGFFRPIEVVMPPGTVVNCDAPAPVRANTITVGADVGDVVMKAAEGFAPDRVGTCVIDLLAPWFWGRDERGGGTPYVHYELLCTPTAAGGVSGADGWGAFPATFASADVPTVEMSELQYPVLYRQGEFTTDSAAPGEWRGTPAWATQRQVYRTAGPVSHTIRIQGCVWPLHGFCGGMPASGNYAITGYRTDREQVISEFTDGETCHEGEIVFFQSGGGGGWGDPLARDPERVRRDVIDELVSAPAAWDDYGVRVDPKTYELDLAETLAERERRSHERSTRASRGRDQTLHAFPPELRREIEARTRSRDPGGA